MENAPRATARMELMKIVWAVSVETDLSVTDRMELMKIVWTVSVESAPRATARIGPVKIVCTLSVESKNNNNTLEKKFQMSESKLTSWRFFLSLLMS